MPAGIPSAARRASHASAAVRRRAPPRSRRPARPAGPPAPGWWRTARRRCRAARTVPATGARCRTRSAPVRRRCGTGRRARSTGGGCRSRAAPRARRSTGCPGRRARRRPRRAGWCARPGRVRCVSRSCSAASDAVGAVHPGQQVADRDADLRRLVRRGTGQRHQPGLALRDLVVARAAALGPVVAEAGDREHHQPRVDLVQPLDREAEPVEHAGPEVLHQHVGAGHQPGQELPALLGLEVGGHRLLVAVRDRKYVDTGSSSGPTNGGPQDRESSPPSGVSTLITRAPRSPSIIAACGPGERAGQVDDDQVGEHPERAGRASATSASGRRTPAARPGPRRCSRPARRRTTSGPARCCGAPAATGGPASSKSPAPNRSRSRTSIRAVQK